MPRLDLGRPAVRAAAPGRDTPAPLYVITTLPARPAVDGLYVAARSWAATCTGLTGRHRRTR